MDVHFLSVNDEGLEILKKVGDGLDIAYEERSEYVHREVHDDQESEAQTHHVLFCATVQDGQRLQKAFRQEAERQNQDEILENAVFPAIPEGIGP